MLHHSLFLCTGFLLNPEFNTKLPCSALNLSMALLLLTCLISCTYTLRLDNFDPLLILAFFVSRPPDLKHVKDLLLTKPLSFGISCLSPSVMLLLSLLSKLSLKHTFLKLLSDKHALRVSKYANGCDCKLFLIAFFGQYK